MKFPKSFEKKYFTRDKDTDYIDVWNTRPIFDEEIGIWEVKNFDKGFYGHMSLKIFKAFTGHSVREGEFCKFRDHGGGYLTKTNY